VMCFIDHPVASKMSNDAKAEANVSGSSSVDGLVYVSAVEHPEHFWLQVLSERSMQLDTLIKEMTSFYETQVQV